MSLYYCDPCKRAFLPEATQTNGHQLFCRKCQSALINLGAEDSRVSLQGHIQSKDRIDPKALYSDMALIKSTHYTTPKKDPILMDCEYKLKLNPLNTEALYTLSQWYFSQGMVNEANAIAQQIIGIDPNFEAAQTFLSQHTRHPDISSDTLPNDTQSLETMAIHLVQNHHHEQAEIVLKKLIQNNPKHSAARRYLIEIYTQQSKFDDAIFHLNRLAMQFPDDAYILYNLAVVCYEAKDFTRAKSNLKAAQNACRDDELMVDITTFLAHLNQND